MKEYDKLANAELIIWKNRMMQKPSLVNKLSSSIQAKINSWIPEKVHKVITGTIKQMVRGVLFGAKYTTAEPLMTTNLQTREEAIRKKIEWYKNSAAVEGGITGAGGILLGLADFPILISLKIKLLFDIAALYGFDVNDYRERVYLLYIFELAFSSHHHRRDVFIKMKDWIERPNTIPEDIHQFDWRKFQQEYRDYIDIAKMAQLVPVIGAPVGILVNFRLVKKLGLTAMNAYRMRIIGPSFV